MQSYRTMMSKSILYDRQIRNFFGVKVHLFRNQKLQYPTKTKPQNKNEVVCTQKIFSLLPRWQAPSTWGRTMFEARPFPSKIQLQMTSEPQIPLVVNFGKTRQFPASDA